MKRRLIIIFLLALSLLVAVILIAPPIMVPPPVVDESRIVYDSLLVSLPANSQAARTELQRVRREMTRLRPSKPYIVIDTHANKIILRTMDSVIQIADCSTGTGGELVDTLTGRHWVFDTPRGIFTVSSMLVEPWWRRPDWAYIEESEPIPEDEGERMDDEMLGKYAIGFGDGFFIHGTIYERLLGISVTHGCVRVGENELQNLYERTRIGMQVYIF